MTEKEWIALKIWKQDVYDALKFHERYGWDDDFDVALEKIPEDVLTDEVMQEIADRLWDQLAESGDFLTHLSWVAEKVLDGKMGWKNE